MPEIAEVTKLAQHLKSNLTGATFLHMMQGPPPWMVVPPAHAMSFHQLCQKRYRVIDVLSRAKFLNFIMQSPLGGDLHLISHMKFSGWWVPTWGPHLPRKFIHPEGHSRMRITTDRGQLHFNDPRSLGKLWLMSPGSLRERPPWVNCGVEVMDAKFTLDYFLRKAYSTRSLICDFLINQENFSGLGNYLRCEIMYAAKQYPWQKSRDIEKDQLAFIYFHINNTVNRAMAHDDYEWWQVFQRKHLPGREIPVIRKAHQGRGIYFAPTIQTYGANNRS